MLSIDLGTIERFNSETSEFEYIEGGVVRFEYSLKVLYGWEGRWGKAFLNDKEEITNEEAIDLYLRMAIDPFDPILLSDSVMMELSEYIADPKTATVFTSGGVSGGQRRSRKVYTSEEIYAMMFSAGVPLEFENRNLNRLLTILRVISINNSPPKKMSRADVLKQNAKLNAERRAKHNTKG